MKCSHCGSENVLTQIVSVNKRGRLNFTTFMQALFMTSGVMLVFIPLIGWVIILLMYMKGYKATSETWAVCQDCGNKTQID